MSEASFLLTVRSFSPLWRWSSLSSQSNTSWTALCAFTEDAYRCDDHAAQYTTAAVSANLTFYGTSIGIYGNATGGMEWTMAIDGKQSINSNSSSGFSAQLASWTGLSSGQHVLTLETLPGPSGSAFNLDRADVTVGTGTNGANVSTSYVDSLNSSIRYSSGYWTNFRGYDDTFQPPGVNNHNFTGANVVGEKASLVFSDASTIVWYGPCYQECGAYSVSIDSEPATSYNGTWDTPRAVAEDCVRFMRSDLDPSQQHAITITVLEAKFVDVDYFQLFAATNSSGISGSPTSSGTPSSTGLPGSSSPPSSSSHKSTVNAGAIAGGVVGGIGALVIALILFLFWRRRRARKDPSLKPVPFAASAGPGAREKSPLDEELGAAGGLATLDMRARTDPLAPFPPDSLSTDSAGPSPTTPASYIDGTNAAAVGAAYEAQHHNPSPPQPHLNPSSHILPALPLDPATFSPDRVDYRPPEKAASSAATISSHSRPIGALRSETSSPGLRVPESTTDRSHNRTETISSYPLSGVGSESASSRRGRGSGPSVSTGSGHGQTTNAGHSGTGGGSGRGGITLTQISQDVNRILTTLGRLRITPGEPVPEDELASPNDAHYEVHPSAEHDDGTSPPEYDESGVDAPTRTLPVPPAPAPTSTNQSHNVPPSHTGPHSFSS